MALDLKYGRVTTERGDIGDDEPVMVFRAQDGMLPHLIEVYRQLCAQAGSPQHHLDNIAATRAMVVEWQEQHATQVRTPPTSSAGPVAL
jgi:hypothetical protein